MSVTTGKLLSKMDVADQESLAKHIGAQRSRQATINFATFAKAVVERHEGITNTIYTNGEKELIENTGSLGLKTIFDVGANIGNWTKLAHAAHAQAQIHAFEIVPETFKTLQSKTSELSDRVTLNDFGLSDVDGTVDVCVDPSSSVLSSMLDFAETAVTPGAVEKVPCQVKRGEAYCQEAGIDEVDFLKIDVEGAEHQVIAGFMPMIEARKVRLLQFEYNRGAIISHFLLRDFYQLLEPLGYSLGKLYPDGVQFHDYTLAHEDFHGPNYVACLKDDTDMRQAISV
jgi:FkbM family methyltransferase